MYYKTALEKTLVFVENNLMSPFTLEDLSKVNGFSRCHFSKLFHIFTGYTISGYIRSRRLTEAAGMLLESDRKIVDIALDFQFSSQDAFTRSFTKTFGISPAKYRKDRAYIKMLPPIEAEKIIWTYGGREMKPEIVELKKILICGMVYDGKNLNGEIGELWSDFFKRQGEIKHAVGNMKSYGICEPVEENVENLNLDIQNDFKYLAGIEVDSVEDLPSGMEVWEVTHSKYAVFTHIGSVEGLGDTYKGIYSKWLPESGYEAVYEYDFELYDKDFDPNKASSKMYIYVPVK
ncbi:AraC family transcriptional regulator [Acidaminobacter sp. JC074]|uniref:AraC family transcriptional regulator n=1 Tax=Acidaminobacter sp. JC074 TaxID=2530199 RepID=UPI001F0F20C3|nr:AraC family transcriptional regulator [Acidaminobacter sp. JC074]MCH4890352.1 AraC family transcriptional regulator [Acidaminobacter sp. JC074]